jgi:hypothetical protein
MKKDKDLENNFINNVKLPILGSSYWEHFKMAKDLALYLPITHPKRINLEKEINDIQNKINQLKK